MTEPTTTESPAQTPRDLLKRLQQDYKVIGECQPLAIGIDKQLLAREPAIDKKVLRVALAMHTKSVRYLKALQQAANNRFNLDESPAGEVSEEQRTLAADTLRERFKKRAEEHKAQETAKKKAEKEAAAERERVEKLKQLQEKFGRR